MKHTQGKCSVYVMSKIKEQEANARLIASAPELLKTLKTCGLLLGEIAQSKSKYSDDAMAAMSWILRAIKSAEGEGE